MKKQITSMSFGELSVTYFPHLCERHARRKLRSWITLCKPLHRALTGLAYTDSTRSLTPKMVLAIYQFLGEP